MAGKNLKDNAGNAAALFARANAFASRGETEVAKEAYMAALTADPAHLGALNDFGALLVETGYRSAAKTVYAQAIAQHGGDAKAHVNLGNILFDENDLAGAQKCYEDALGCDDTLPEAHQGLMRIFAARRDDAGMARHAEKGFRGHSVNVQPYYGAGKPVELLLLVAAAGGNIPLKHHIDNKIFKVTAVFADYYDEDDLPAHDLAFNAIGDADFCGAALQAAVRFLQKTPAPVINPPEKVLRTGRADNARHLAAIEDVRTAETRLLKKERLTAADLAFPLLLRAPGFHTGQHFLKVDAAQDLAAALEQLPGEEVLALEYLDARGRDGRYRKYRVMTIGGQLYPLHTAVSEDWKVHYFTSLQYQEEERKFLEDMESVIGAKGVAALQRIADTLDLDYGGIDFGLDAEGDILLFEANATMVINPPPPEAPEHCKRAIAKAAAAVQNMLKTRGEKS